MLPCYVTKALIAWPSARASVSAAAAAVTAAAVSAIAAVTSSDSTAAAAGWTDIIRKGCNAAHYGPGHSENQHGAYAAARFVVAGGGGISGLASSACQRCYGGISSSRRRHSMALKVCTRGEQWDPTKKTKQSNHSPATRSWITVTASTAAPISLALVP